MKQHFSVGTFESDSAEFWDAGNFLLSETIDAIGEIWRNDELPNHVPTMLRFEFPALVLLHLSVELLLKALILQSHKILVADPRHGHDLVYLFNLCKSTNQDLDKVIYLRVLEELNPIVKNRYKHTRNHGYKLNILEILNEMRELILPKLNRDVGYTFDAKLRRIED